jgi:hypothetical protein
VSALDQNIQALLNYGAAFVKLRYLSKMAVEKGWANLISSDESQIAEWLEKKYNIGIYLGYANLIDVEYDNEDGKAQLEKMGLLNILTPMWSSSRGEHRLFRLEKMPDNPPRYIKLNNRGGEIRIGGRASFSAVPPSVHETRIEYKWIISPQECEPAVLKYENLIN